MTRGAVILTIVMGLLLGGTVWASTTGFGVPQPEDEAPSIREGSAHLATGHTRTRYFIAGGYLLGK